MAILKGDLTAVQPHFDADFYRAMNTDLKGSDKKLLMHFMLNGWKEGRDPQPGFSVNAYLARYPDIAESGGNPFLHYIQFGRAEGRSAAPITSGVDGAMAERLEADLASLQPQFDAAFYRMTYSDVTGNDDDLLLHFMQTGWHEGRDPAPGFSTSAYLERYPDVASAGGNPFLHYIRFGRAEGRSSGPLGAESARAAVTDLAADLVTVGPHFDAEFYRLMNTDLTGNDEELLLHFMQTGWKEGRDPQPGFSTQYYLKTYPDIAGDGGNPFLHYVLFGQAEGRRGHGDEPVQLALSATADVAPAHMRPLLVRPDLGLQTRPPTAASCAGALSLHWVIPDLSRGSGGHMTIIRMVRYLERFGHRCKIWIEQPSFHSDGDAAYQTIVKYFQCVQAEVALVEDGFFEATGDGVIATGWSTAYLVQQACGFKAKYYFVQDHEPEFYPTGAEGLMARRTYDFDLACICASPWLQQIMTSRYGRWARSFYLAYDPDQYRILDPEAHQRRFDTLPAPERRKIAIYARDHTARRCVSLILMGLQILGQQRQDFEVHFFGVEALPFSKANFHAVSHGVLESSQLQALYNGCHIGVCFSGTNYSLVPQEMMACGLPLLELDTESTRAIFPSDVVRFGGPMPDQIAEQLGQMLDDPGACRAQSEAALNWVQQFSWEKSARQVEAHILEYLDSQTQLSAPAVAASQAVMMDVVIPTYNGLDEVTGVIKALRAQHNAEQLQIHCIDSNSSDGTTQWLQAQPDVSLTLVAQAEFQHGRTRNDGAACGDAPVIAFLTQDALPAGRDWSDDIVKMMQHYPQAAGLFGRHLPYPEHPIWVRQEIEAHFDTMLRHPLLLSKDTDVEKWDSGDQGWRQLLHFYSDNNSAMRRSVWQDHPYPEVDYGEDQIWARDIIAAGYGKLYAPTAAVYHSHDYTPAQTYARSRTEADFFYRHFGYQLGRGSAEDLAARIDQECTGFLRRFQNFGISADKIEMQLDNIAQKHFGWRDGLTHALAAE